MQEHRTGIVGQIQRFSNLILGNARTQSSHRQKLLFVSDDAGDALGPMCERLNLELNCASSLSLALRNLECYTFGVVIYDQDLTGQDWRSAIASMARVSPASSILLLTTFKQPEIWREIIRNGGHDILTKPITEKDAESTIALARANAKVNRNLGHRKNKDY